MKKIVAISLVMSCTLGLSAQHQYVQTIYAVMPDGGNPQASYNGTILIQQPAASGQYLNLIRAGGEAWSIGTVYNSGTFAIGTSKLYDSEFTAPFFTIKPTGYVGMGTPSPVSKLEISAFGSTPSPYLYSGSNDLLTITGSTSSNQGFNVISAGNGAYNRGILKATRSRGTPSAPTSVANGDVVMTLIGSAYNGIGAYATAGINTVVDGAVSSSLVPQALTFETGTGVARSEKMRISSEGNVGVGTTTTTTTTTLGAKFDIVGAYNNLSLRVTNNVYNDWVLQKRRSDNTQLFGIKETGSNGSMSLVTNNLDRLIITNSGTVGIGTSTPNSIYALDVNGIICANEVKVTLNHFPDFVFDSEYNLPKLNDVHNYIKANGHLPNIPSATEVKENGIGLADMQVRLLQKVEELTLYVIEQQKRIEVLEKTLKEK